MKRINEVIALLADGQFHSGEDVGEALGVSRSAIWKIIKGLEEIGIDVHRVQGRGYCIPGGIQFFSKERIESFLLGMKSTAKPTLDIFNRVASTNSYLQDKIKAGYPSQSICLSEYQTEGRGRRGRAWLSPYGKNIYMSLLWKFSAGPSALAGLTLLVGLAMIRALTTLGLTDLRLKWPNDILWHGSKLAGILVEMSIDDLNGCYAVIGLGLNLSLPQKIRSEVSQRVTDIQTILGHYPDKNYVTALLIHELFSILPEFEAQGFAPYVSQWQGYDHLLNKQITLKTPQQRITGIGQGIDETGALIMKVNGEFERFHSGEATIEEITSS